MQPVPWPSTTVRERPFPVHCCPPQSHAGACATLLTGGSRARSNCALIGLGAVGLHGLFRRNTTPGFDRAGAVAIVGGLFVAPALLLCATYMTFRYRVEFYPLLEFTGLLGALRIACDSAKPAFRWVAIASDVSVVVALLLLFAYRQLAFGPVTEPWGAHHLNCPAPFCAAPPPP